MIVFANVGILKIFARDKMHLYTKGSLYTLTESELQIFTLCSSCVEYNSSFIQANFAINMHWNNANTHSLIIFTFDCSLNVGIYKELHFCQARLKLRDM